MTTITAPGSQLAWKLNPYIGTTAAIAETCSLLTRHGKTLDGIQVRWCNDEMSDRATAALEAREKRIEDRMRDLTDMLPHTDDGPWRIQFDGDPRGFTSRLIAPDGHEIGIA